MVYKKDHFMVTGNVRSEVVVTLALRDGWSLSHVE
jgi:hypothetical protein